MKIIVCVKQVLDTAAKIKLAEGRVDPQGSPRVMNPYDEFAVAESVKLRDRFPDSEVTLLTLGPENFKDVLKTGLAMGADHAKHLLDPAFDGLDNLGVAKALAKAVRTIGFDLILCGKQAVDDDMAQTGTALAVLLGIPFVTVVTQLEIADDQKRATVTRQIEGGSDILEGSWPLLITCQKGLNEPRLPSLKGIMAAKKKPIDILTAGDIGFHQASEGTAANRVRELGLTLPTARKSVRMIEGSPEEATRELARILREEEKLI